MEVVAEVFVEIAAEVLVKLAADGLGCRLQIWLVAEIVAEVATEALAEVVEVFDSLRLFIVLLIAVRYWDFIGS